MRLIKMLGLAAVAAIAAMAFLGASSAAALPTSLCKEASESLECPAGQRAHEFTMAAGTTVLKTSLLTVLCLGSKGTGVVTSANNLGTPLQVEVTSLAWESCGSNAEHTNCTVENVALPTFDVLKTEADLGEATALGASVHVTCSGLNCYYGGAAVGPFVVESSGHTEGSGKGMFTASELSVPKVKGFLCPKESFWTALYEPTEALWLRS